MLPNKLNISQKATSTLRYLKGRTGITPNIYSRLAFCLSLREKTEPDPKNYDNDGMEFNRYTLMGDYEPLITSLLRIEWEKNKISLSGSPTELLLSHINRGVEIISKRVKSVSDIPSLVPKR